MIKILNQSRQPVAILENAYRIGYSKKVNEIWGASFSLPLDDPKNAECLPLNYVEIIDDLTGEYIGLFRIIPTSTIKDANANEVSYECEHVIATLLDDVIFGMKQTTNLTTAANIQALLDMQTTKHWRLGKCDFTRYFHHNWENTNGLIGPLFSIPQPFDVKYEWTYDTQSYPWTVSLVAPASAVTCEIRYGINQARIERVIDPANIVNRIYPIGQGEGINQLNIREVNGGKPYLEDSASISTYGLKSYVWVDRRFSDKESLKASAQALLNDWKFPKVTYIVEAVDLSSITGIDVHKLRLGRIVRIVDPDLGTFEARIVSESKADIVGAPGNIRLEIANKSDDLGTIAADLERRQTINEVYSQGSTNIDSHSFSDNADQNNPAVIRFYLPDDLVRVNTLDLTFETQRFRAYSKAAKTTSTEVKTTSSGGGSTITSSAGGQSSITSSSGGGQSVTSSAGGGTTTTTSNKTFAQANIMSGVPENAVGSENYGYHQHEVQIPGSIFSHDHTISIGNHSHSIQIGNHSHTVQTPSHSHSVQIDPHSHTLEIPGHGHSLEYGIWEESSLPSQVTVKVDGQAVPGTAISRDSLDLIPYLAKDSEGRVQRGTWHTVELKPNGLARINATVISRLFIQSHTGGSY